MAIPSKLANKNSCPRQGSPVTRRMMNAVESDSRNNPNIDKGDWYTFIWLNLEACDANRA